MKKNAKNFWQHGFLNISLAAVITGISVIGSFISTEIAHFNQSQPQTTTAAVQTSVTPNQTTTTNVLPPNYLAKVQTPPVATPVVKPLATPIDCDTDSSCLTANAQLCSPATAILTSTFDVFGITETLKNNYVIVGPGKNNTCNYNTTVISATITPDAAFKKEAAIHKTSLTNIQSDLAPAQLQLNNTIVGTTTTCSQPIASIMQFITGMTNGNIATQYMNTNDPACTITTNSSAISPAISATAATASTTVSTPIITPR